MARQYCKRGWQVELQEAPAPVQLAARWRELERRSQCSFFQSWSWIGTWLRTVTSDMRPLLVEARRGGRTVALAVLGTSRIRRKVLMPSHALLVSETGDATYDSLTVEHNGMLVERSRESEALRECFERLLGDGASSWDELVIGGLPEAREHAYVKAADACGLKCVSAYRHPDYCVDLADLRARSAEYLSTLNANTRSQIRRSIRAYERRGDLQLSVANGRQEMRSYFAELCRLHQQHWVDKGYPGAFVDDKIRLFHERLMDVCEPPGQVQLIRVAAGTQPFAYLYNFVFRGVVYSYQAGFAYEADPKLKPGLVAHSLAITYNLKRGYRTYDLLMGDARYKRSLAHHQGHMVRLSIRRPGLALTLETGLRGWWRRWKSSKPAERNRLDARSGVCG